MEIYKGGCACGRIRFELTDHPIWVIACHCNACKKRTGSDYGISVMADSSKVTGFENETKTFIRIGDSGKEVHCEFCPDCGTTLRWKIGMFPGRKVIAGGAYDDINNVKFLGEMYTDYKATWVNLGCDLSRPQVHDEEFRRALIEKAKALR